MNTFDNIIDAIFQALPASSFQEILDQVQAQGFIVNAQGLRAAICFLRRNAIRYGWTIPHVGTHPEVYFAILVAKDGQFHTDPAFKKSLLHGSKHLAKNIITQNGNHCLMLRAAGQALHVHRPLREEFTNVAEIYEFAGKQVKRAFRKVDEMNGTNGE